MERTLRSGRRRSPQKDGRGDQYLFRFPRGLREQMQQRANENGRALAGEMIQAIEEHLKNGSKLQELERRIQRLEATMLWQPN